MTTGTKAIPCLHCDGEGKVTEKRMIRRFVKAREGIVVADRWYQPIIHTCHACLGKGVVYRG